MSDQFNEVPVVTLRDMVVYPHGVQPLFIGTAKSIRALERSNDQQDKKILLLAKRDPANENPEVEDLFDFGTVATILQLIRLPDKTVKILVEGNSRARVINVRDDNDCFVGDVELLPEELINPGEAHAMIREVMDSFDQYVKQSKKIPPEVMTSISSIEDPSRLVDTIASQLTCKLDIKQKLL